MALATPRLLFLGNIQPDLQRGVRAEADGARFVALDSMNLWIDTARDSLVAAIGEIDCLLLNDAELRMLTERAQPDPRRPLGPRAGPAASSSPSAASTAAALFTARAPSRFPRCRSRRSATRPAPATASPAASSATSTARAPTTPPPSELRRAMVIGSVMASFNVEDFGTERVRRLERPEIDARVGEFKALTHFEE